MEKRNKLILTFSILIFLVITLYLFTDWFSKSTGYTIGEDPDIKLARCLSQKGALFYSSKSCSNCRLQENFFSDAFKFVPSIDCSSEYNKCSKLESLPAWFINGKIHYNIFSLNELKILSGCQG